MAPCYVHGQTSLRLMLDLLRPSSHTKGYLEEYEVEEILDSRFRWGKLWYLVKFIGWSNLDNMWLPHTEVHTLAMVKEFHLQHPDALHTSRTSTDYLTASAIKEKLHCSET